MKLGRDFYIREDVVQISRELLGKYLFTRIGSNTTAGIITETEAYAGAGDRASHAWGSRCTARTAVMYREGGRAYVYLCYGMHHLFNVVTNREGVPHAVLIRSVRPVEGTGVIRKRRGRRLPLYKLAEGPGNVSRALGIHTGHTGTDLLGATIWIEDRGMRIGETDITAGPRVGVAYAGADALLPYRFHLGILNPVRISNPDRIAGNHF